MSVARRGKIAELWKSVVSFGGITEAIHTSLALINAIPSNLYYPLT